MSTNEQKKTATFGIGRMIVALLLGVILWGLVNLFYFWPQERSALRLLKELAATQAQSPNGQAPTPGERKGITFDEFKTFATEHGLNWNSPSENPQFVRFKVSTPYCLPAASFKDGRLEYVSFGCLN